MLQSLCPIFMGFFPRLFLLPPILDCKFKKLLTIWAMQLPQLIRKAYILKKGAKGPIPLYLSGRAIPGLAGTIMGLDGGLIIGGPGIIGICPPIGGLIPGAIKAKKITT